MVSPSGGLELRHMETDIAPECSIGFPAGRIDSDGKLDQRFVEVVFVGGAFVRVHWHDDTSGVKCLGHDLPEPIVDAWPMLDKWTDGDGCPDPQFYRVLNSDWIPALPSHFVHHQHYIIDGRDGCIEVAAERYTWFEWAWPTNATVEEVRASKPYATGEETG